MRAEKHTLTSAEWTSCSACHELLCSRTFLFIVLRSAQHPQIISLVANFSRNLANAPPPPESFRTCFVCATHAFPLLPAALASNSNSNYFCNTNPNGTETNAAGSIILPSPSYVKTVHELILNPDLSRFCVCFCVEVSTPLISLLGMPRQDASPLVFFWCRTEVAAAAVFQCGKALL